MSNPYDTQVGGNHYKDMKIQPSEFINKNELQFAEGNAIKYICRHGSKGGLQDLQKAKHYIDMIIERDYANEVNNSSVDSGVNITYEGLSVTLPESDKDSMDDLSEGFKDDLNGEIFYPSGASVGKEGFDE
mgnify:FL=1